MKNILLFTIPGLLAICLAKDVRSQTKITDDVFTDPSSMRKYQSVITAEELLRKLTIIASDSFEGRGTGSRGQKMAAAYIVSQFTSIGLQPLGSHGEKRNAASRYLQPVELYPAAPRAVVLTFTMGREKINSTFAPEVTDDRSYYVGGGAGNSKGTVVFAGYGISDDTLAYDDYAALRRKKISVQDKWLMVFDKEPPGLDKNPIKGAAGRLSPWSRGWMQKQIAVWKTGERPLGILVIPDTLPGEKKSFSENAAAAAQLLQRNSMLLLLDPTLYIPPVYAISQRMADQILTGSSKTAALLKREIDSRLRPLVFDVRNAVVESVVQKREKVRTENVLGFLEGSDPVLRNEIVVLSAHYDHLGMDTTLSGDRIFNGAADDGSGTAALLQLAAAFKKAKEEGKGPRRSILFAAFTAEEKGKLGSYFFTNLSPAVPLASIVATINMDGVGGIDGKHPTGSRNYVYIYGEKDYSDKLVRLNREVKAAIGSDVELTDAPPGFSSDHEGFRDYGVPFIYFSTGRTDHYHQVSDEAATIDYDHMNRVARLIFATCWQVVNQTGSIRDATSVWKRSKYKCAPCQQPCDALLFEKPGLCPACRMVIVPRYLKEAKTKP